jgi:DNA ligase-4
MRYSSSSTPRAVRRRLPPAAHSAHPRAVWVETKYDGERAQIHVRVLPNGFSRITIFSKSGRDSTLDRHAVHGIVREALGLAPAPPVPGLTELAPAPPIKDVVLEAEMVAYSRELDRIDGAWSWRQMVGSS